MTNPLTPIIHDWVRQTLLASVADMDDPPATNTPTENPQPLVTTAIYEINNKIGMMMTTLQEVLAREEAVQAKIISVLQHLAESNVAMAAQLAAAIASNNPADAAAVVTKIEADTAAMESAITQFGGTPASGNPPPPTPTAVAPGQPVIT